MSRRAKALISGLFGLLQLTLSSAGGWPDADLELAALSADVHIEDGTDSCIPGHDHRLCMLGRSVEGTALPRATVPQEPVVTDESRPRHAGVPILRADRSHRASPRGPPSLA